MKRNAFLLLPIVISLLFLSPLSAALYPWDWGTTGVADTSTVIKVLQLTDDTGDNQLNSGTEFMPSPWSKDGQWIVYENVTEGRICKVNAVTAVSLCLTPPPGPGEGVHDPSFGIDNKIYFGKTLVSGPEIWRMNSDGTDPESLTANHGGTHEEYGQISPDGQWIVFSSGSALWVTTSDGTSAPVKVSDTVLVDTSQHSWSPDSQWLVYRGNDGSGNWIYKTDVTGTGNKVLTRPPMFTPGEHEHGWPAWSPDGKTIAYIWSKLGTFPAIYYNIRTIGTDGQPIEANLDSAVSPSSEWQTISTPLSWSPDSQWLTYGKQGLHRSLFIVNTADPSDKSQLTENYDDNTPFWSPAGDRILFMDAGLCG